VMPIMQSCAEPDKFIRLLVMAIFSLTVLYIWFGYVCYFAFGASTDPIVTEMLPSTSPFTLAIKVVFCLNLVFGYSICINPTNTIIESWMFGGMKATTTRKWFKNISRTFVCFLSIILAVQLGESINKFLGLLGAMLCSPLALTIPACLHLKVLAKTTA
jgi:proton-coupled amino acid transporter